MKSRYYFQATTIGIVSCLVAVLFLVGVRPLKANVDVSATMNTQSFPLDRVATLNLTVNGVRSFQPQIPEVEGLQFHQRGQSTQLQIVNGSYSASVTTTFLVQAMRVGHFIIPPIQVGTQEGNFVTKPIAFEVTAASSTRPQVANSGVSSSTRLGAGDAEEVAFLRVTPAKEISYSGEEVPVQIKAYFRDGIQIRSINLPQLIGEGFVLQQLSGKPVQSREIVNNVQYTVLTWNSSLSGIKEGTHTLGMELEARLLSKEQRRRSSQRHPMFNDPFFGDSFFDDFFGSYREKEVTIASPELEVTVCSLPVDGRPENFSGAIGDFKLDVSAEPVEIWPGDPITLRMTVSGHGNFNRVQVPKLSREKGWKIYTPSAEYFEDTQPGYGKKVFEQAIVAKDRNLNEIPIITFSYFDPDVPGYKTLSADPIPFKFQGKATKEEQSEPVEKISQETGKEKPETSAQRVEPRIKTLAPLQLAPGGMEQKLEPLFKKQWFQLLVALIVLVLGAAAIHRIQAARHANDPRLQKNKMMKNQFALREKEINAALAANDTKNFLSSCRRIIQEQLGFVWGIEAGAITVTDLKKRLPTDSTLLLVFSAAEESAYGGRELSSQQMKEYAEGMKEELEGLV